MEHSIYVVSDKERKHFKVGYSNYKTVRDRLKQYISHNPEVVIQGFFKVPYKLYEKSIQTELKKLGYIPCPIKGQKEWFNGSVELTLINEIIDKITEDLKYTKLLEICDVD